jgi:hypothetical protein
MTQGFDLEAFRQTGVQVVKNFFEPDMREYFADLGRQISEEVATGRAGRQNQLVSGLDVNAAAHVSQSAALQAVARDMYGPDVCYLLGRVLMKDKAFAGSIEVHQDWPYFGGDTRKLNAFVPLTRCRPENGMIVFYEGSHAMGPVERGAIDVGRYPEFAPYCPDLEVGDILFADFLTWHSSAPSVEDEDRILLQVVLQPGSDRSSNNLFDGSWRPIGRHVPYRTSPMLNAVPSISVGPARGFLAAGEIEEAERMARGLAIDSALNVEAQLLLHDIAVHKGEDGAGHIAAAQTALASLADRVAQLRPPPEPAPEPELQPSEPDAQARIEELEAELAQIRRSTSWRVTAPLRWLRGVR